MLEQNDFDVFLCNEDNLFNLISDINTGNWIFSALHFPQLNYTYKNDNLINLLTNKDNITYSGYDKKTKRFRYVAILQDIDLLQTRAGLVLLYDSEIKKEVYSGTKILLNKAFNELSLELIYTSVYKNDVYRMPLLKGFGFIIAGLYEKFVRFQNESYDINTMILYKHSFNSINTKK